jgi:ABC-2 type transport system permease protein
MSTYFKMEILRTVRNGRYLIFTFLIPMILFLVIGAPNKGQQAGAVTLAAYYMTSMALYGAMAAVMTSGGRIAMERAVGWNRQLRLTGLSGRSYIMSKIMTGYATALPGMILILAAGALTHSANISPQRWLGIAAAILIGLAPMAALGVLIGYVATGESMQQITGLLFMLLSLLSGIWFSINSGWFLRVAEASPLYWAGQAARDAMQGIWVGWHGVAVIAIWTVVLARLAMSRYQRATARA